MRREELMFVKSDFFFLYFLLMGASVALITIECGVLNPKAKSVLCRGFYLGCYQPYFSWCIGCLVIKGLMIDNIFMTVLLSALEIMDAIFGVVADFQASWNKVGESGSSFQGLFLIWLRTD